MSRQERRLTLDRDETTRQIESLRAELDDLIASARSTNGDDEHDPEGATIGFERAQTQAMLDAAEERLPEIDAALARMTAGTYGVCLACGGPISAARLDARPEADRCIACASRG